MHQTTSGHQLYFSYGAPTRFPAAQHRTEPDRTSGIAGRVDIVTCDTDGKIQGIDSHSVIVAVDSDYRYVDRSPTPPRGSHCCGKHDDSTHPLE